MVRNGKQRRKHKLTSQQRYRSEIVNEESESDLMRRVLPSTQRNITSRANFNKNINTLNRFPQNMRRMKALTFLNNDSDVLNDNAKEVSISVSCHQQKNYNGVLIHKKRKEKEKAIRMKYIIKIS